MRDDPPPRRKLTEPGPQGPAGAPGHGEPADAPANRRLLLASASPRRRELIGSLGAATTIAPAVEEPPPAPGELVPDYVECLARLKAAALAHQATGSTIVAADTAVIVDGGVLGKPASPEDARAMLSRLRDTGTHTVITAVAVLPPGDAVRSASETTEVRMRPYTDAEIERYIAGGDPFDKAGAYAIQHEEFAPVAAIRGCYLNVVGLPLCLTEELLEGRDPGGRRDPLACRFCRPRMPSVLAAFAST